MNYYRSGSRNNSGYSDRGWRNQDWNPYAGEEEPIEMDRNRGDENYGYGRRQDSWEGERGCCRGDRDRGSEKRPSGRYMERDRRENERDRKRDDRSYEQRWDYRSMAMPELSQEERNDMNHWTPCRDWDCQKNTQMMPQEENNRNSDRKNQENQRMTSANQEKMNKNMRLQNEWPQEEKETQRQMGGQMTTRSQNESMTPKQQGDGRMPQKNMDNMENIVRPQAEIALDGGTTAGLRNGMPYQTFDYQKVLEEEEQLEQDFRRLQSMYPQAVQEIIPYIEEACDKMEYEGSMMFDEMPDRNMVRQISDGIYEKVQDIYPMEHVQTAPDEVLSMQYQGRRRNPPGQNLLNDLIQVMLLQDMHRRRCRHRRCRPHMYR